MSALGQKQTCAAHQVMSALPPKADMCSAIRDVRFVPKADSCAASTIDQLVGAFEHRRRDSQTERSSGL